jgi:anti-sigma factor RsiW
MHPRSAALIAFCDGETGASQSARIANHLSKCETCRSQLRRIRSEKAELLACAAARARDGGRDLAGVLSAMAAWRENRDSGAAAELKSRVRWQIETFFGAPAVAVVERPGVRAEELLGNANAVLEAFLGPEAAQAVNDDVLRGMDWAGPSEEASR